MLSRLTVVVEHAVVVNPMRLQLDWIRSERDVENEAEFHNPEVILRSTSHVSQASQRSRLSQQSTTRNVHRERVPNPQIPPSLVPTPVSQACRSPCPTSRRRRLPRVL